MSNSPDVSQKTYKVKSESKQSQLLRPENPFNRSAALVKPLIIDSSDDEEDVDRLGNTDFVPTLGKKPSIFDKLDGAADPDPSKAAVVDKRLVKKKGGKLFKGVAY